MVSVAIAAWAAYSSHVAKGLAREALRLQRRQVENSDIERTRLAKAEVVPVKWESRAASPRNQVTEIGLVVTNRGPGRARNVRAECLVASLFRTGSIPLLPALRSYGLRDELKDFTPEHVGELPEPRADGEYVARCFWINEDDTEGACDWIRIPRY